MKNTNKSGGRLLAAALAAMLLLVGCSDAPALQNPENSSLESWAIYWYVCGSDLETRWGSASNDIIELQEPPLPNNVQVVFQTGGAATWNNDMMDSSALYRFERVAEGGISVVETAPLASMGSADTFADFLSFAPIITPPIKWGWCCGITAREAAAAFATTSFSATNICTLPICSRPFTRFTAKASKSRSSL